MSTTDSSKNAFILWQSLLFSQRTSLTSKRFVLNCRCPFSFCLSWHGCILFAKEVQLLLSFYNIFCFHLYFLSFSFLFFFLPFFPIPILKIDRSTSVASGLDEQKQCSLFHWKTVFSWVPIWQLWDTNDSRLKTLDPCALFIPLRANMCIITKANVQQAIM